MTCIARWSKKHCLNPERLKNIARNRGKDQNSIHSLVAPDIVIFDSLTLWEVG